MSAPVALTAEEMADLRARHPAVFDAPPGTALRRWGGWLLFVGLVIFSLWWTDFSPARLWAGMTKLGWLLQLMFPPRDGGWFADLAYALAETLSIAFCGTFIAAAVALPLGFLGAKNVVTNFLFHFSLRRVFDSLRGVDAVIWALIFVSAVGLGPFAGVLAIVMAEIGVFGKLFAEAIENVDRRQVEGVRASGAAPVQVMRFAMLPQVLPILLSTILYQFESNVRYATILGIVGAGGIGQSLSDRIRINRWDEACFIILMILVTVGMIDWLSTVIRRRVIGGSTIGSAA